jgi:hypothetical protein
MPKRVAGQMAGEPRVTRALAAERMRRSRHRRRRGMRCFVLELRDSEIAALVRRGLLAEGEQSDRVAVVKAMYKLLDSTLGRPM